MSRGLRVRRIDAAEDDEVAGMQTGEVLRIEDADGRKALRERSLGDLDGGRAAAVLRHGGEDEGVAVGEGPVAERRRGRAGRRRRRRRRGGRGRRPPGPRAGEGGGGGGGGGRQGPGVDPLPRRGPPRPPPFGRGPRPPRGGGGGGPPQGGAPPPRA